MVQYRWQQMTDLLGGRLPQCGESAIHLMSSETAAHLGLQAAQLRLSGTDNFFTLTKLRFTMQTSRTVATADKVPSSLFSPEADQKLSKYEDRFLCHRIFLRRIQKL